MRHFQVCEIQNTEVKASFRYAKQRVELFEVLVQPQGGH